MNKKLLSLAVLTALSPLSTNAATITGKVVDEQNQPIKNVKIHLHSKDKAVETNENGEFSIEIDSASQLHLSKASFLDIRKSVENNDARFEFVMTKAAIEAITVYASAFHKSNLEMTSPVTVLSGDELANASSTSLGDTLKQLPGISQTYFSPVASSPVIRGLDGPRVRVMQNGLESSDASRVGPDHANSNETLSADQIEILRGPATLLYGSGAIGGVVNVVDSRIPVDSYESLQGAVSVKHDTVNNGNSAAAKLIGGNDGYNVYLDFVKRETDDTEVPSFKPHEEDDEYATKIANSFIDSNTINLGISKVTDHMVLGLSFGRIESDYGIPGHSHHHDEHGHEEEHAHEETHLESEEEAEHNVFARLTQDRYQALLSQSFHNSVIEKFEVRAGYTDYQHAEIEDNIEGTIFSNETSELRGTLEHTLADWHGVIGYHYYNSDYSAAGEEAFTPSSVTKQHALFVLEERKFDALTIEFGARIEKSTINAPEIILEHHHEEVPDHDESHEEALHYNDDFTSISASLGAIYDIAPGYSLALSIGHSERAPSSAEVLSNGLHIATGTYDLGLGYVIEDGEVHFEPEEIQQETANSIDITLRKFAGDFGFSATLYYNKVSDFYYQQDTGLVVDDEHHEFITLEEFVEHGHELEEATRVFKYNHADVDMYGLEYDAHYQLNDSWLAKISGDLVNLEFADSNDSLPRVPQNKLAFGISYLGSNIDAGFTATHYFKQDNVTAFETVTDSYTLFDLTASYRFSAYNNDLKLFAKVENLTDELAYSHTSFIKDIAPLAGRNIQLGLRFDF